MYDLVEVLILGGVLAVAAWSMFGRVSPVWHARMQSRVALTLMSPSLPRPLNRLGMNLLPRVDQHCGSGCSRCGACR